MPSYIVAAAQAEFASLPAPTADAWLQPVNGSIYVSDDDNPSATTAGIVPKMTPYPVSAGKVVKVASASSYFVRLRMWDKT